MFHVSQPFFTQISPLPSLCLDVEQASVIKSKRSDNHRFTVLSTGELVIDHKLLPDHIQLTAMEARNLRNLLNSSDVRSALGIPFDCSPHRAIQQA